MFSHLHVHTKYSILDGMCDIEKLVQYIKELGQTSIAITDHHVLFGVIDFYDTCVKHGIKPIIGMEAYVTHDMKDHEMISGITEQNKKEKKSLKGKALAAYSKPVNIKTVWAHHAENDRNFFPFSSYKIDENGNKIYRYAPAHLILFAKNLTGYKNLLKISSAGFLEGFYTRPRVDLKFLREHGEGIIASSACRGGMIPKLILRGELEYAKQIIKEHQEIFDDFYLEIQPSKDPDQLLVNETLLQFSEEMDIPVIATSDAHYIRSSDSYNHEILLAIQTKTTMDNPKRFKFSENNCYIFTEEEMLEWGIPQKALDNTQLIVDQCNLEFEFKDFLLPHIKPPQSYTIEDYIHKKCYDGLYKYLLENPYLDGNKYKERLEYELDIICSKGLADYMLMVEDFVGWCKKKDILTGPGRGSAAGSLISFVLGITKIDPLQFDLLFSRFINPDRPGMPDIDMDIGEYIDLECFESGRQLLMQYLLNKYGEEYVCQIGTRGTLASKVALKDVGRTLGIDHKLINEVNKLVPAEAGFQWTIEECLNGRNDAPPIKEFQEMYKQYPELFDAAIILEGAPRHTSVHAAGLVLCSEKVRDVLPLFNTENGIPASQFDMKTVEHVKCVKVDLLGLKTLGVIDRCRKWIKQRYGIIIDIYNLPLDDEKTLKLIKSGDTDGVFQLESNLYKNTLKKLNKLSFTDIAALVALK